MCVRCRKRAGWNPAAVRAAGHAEGDGVWTRRAFLSGSAGAAAGFALSPGLLAGLASGDDELSHGLAGVPRAHWRSANRPFLEMAIEAWNWIDASRIDTGRGATWPADPTDPESTGDTLYTHGPGVIPFALELHYATGDEQYLGAATEGAAHLAATLATVQGAGLYTGLAGIAFVLAETWRATGNDMQRSHAGSLLNCSSTALVRSAPASRGPRDPATRRSNRTTS